MLGILDRNANKTKVKKSLGNWRQVTHILIMNQYFFYFCAFQETLTSTQQCVTDYVKKNLILFVKPQDLKEKLEECSKDFIEASENCLPEKEKYYPKFSQEVMEGLIDMFFRNKQNFTCE